MKKYYLLYAIAVIAVITILCWLSMFGSSSSHGSRWYSRGSSYSGGSYSGGGHK